MFLVNSMHPSYVDDNFHFDPSLYEHADVLSHSEHDVEVNANKCMHYENEGVNSILPRVLFQDANLIGGTDENENFSFPQENVNENNVYNKGKSLC